MQADFFEKDSLLQRKEVEVCDASPFLYRLLGNLCSTQHLDLDIVICRLRP